MRQTALPTQGGVGALDSYRKIGERPIVLSRGWGANADRRRYTQRDFFTNDILIKYTLTVFFLLGFRQETFCEYERIPHWNKLLRFSGFFSSNMVVGAPDYEQMRQSGLGGVCNFLTGCKKVLGSGGLPSPSDSCARGASWYPPTFAFAPVTGFFPLFWRGGGGGEDTLQKSLIESTFHSLPSEIWGVLRDAIIPPPGLSYRLHWGGGFSNPTARKRAG